LRPIITYEGIDDAIKNLRFTNRNTLKAKLINTIRDQYRLSGGSVDSVKEIDTDFLVKTLWRLVMTMSLPGAEGKTTTVSSPL
jgi:hypothetical protein